jgi:dynein heavy chain
MFVVIHSMASELAKRFQQEMKRPIFVAPLNFIELVHTFLQLLREKKDAIQASLDRLENGVATIKMANGVVSQMQGELQIIQPVLQQAVDEAEALSAQIVQETQKLDQARNIVKIEEHDLEEVNRQTQLLRDDAKDSLDQAMPAYRAAIKALKALNKNDIIEISTNTTSTFC